MIIQIFLEKFLSSICQEKHDYSNFEKTFIATLNKHAPKKIKTFQGNQKSHINKTLRKAIMKRSQLKTKQSKQNSKRSRHFKL